MAPSMRQELFRHGDHEARDDRPSSREDAALMDAFLRQQADAARTLYDRVAFRIYGLGLAQFRNPADAEDLVQDTFLKIWRTGSAFDPDRGSLDAWILMNARSLSIDRLRRRSLEARTMSREPKVSEASNEPGPEERAEVRDLFRRATEAMDELPPSQRTALELVHLDDRSTREVAELQGVPRGTAKSRVHAAIVSLRKAIPIDDDADERVARRSAGRSGTYA